MAVVTRPAARIGVLSFAVLSLAAGSAAAATINGTPRNDTLRGSARADKVFGKGGNDRLFGAGGNDVLVGGRGNDLLVGGLGTDTLRCGPGRDTATRDALDKVATDCEVVRGPKPPAPPTPPAPTPPPPPLAPGAPATYVFGPEVTAAQQTSLRDALDLGARFIRSALGRELPPFTVWASSDLETIIRLYSETAPTTPENARIIWTRAYGAAQFRKIWFGPLWFRPNATATSELAKIAIAEMSHVLHMEIGPAYFFAHNDRMWPAGPRWLEHGHAEVIGYSAIAGARLANMRDVRANWSAGAKASPTPLQQMATADGMLGAQHAYRVAALAVDRLIGEGGSGKVLSYYEAISRGEAWETAFAAAFGKSVDAFYAEFATYRSGL